MNQTTSYQDLINNPGKSKGMAVCCHIVYTGKQEMCEDCGFYLKWDRYTDESADRIIEAEGKNRASLLKHREEKRIEHQRRMEALALQEKEKHEREMRRVSEAEGA